LPAVGGPAVAAPAARRRRKARVTLLMFAAPAVLWFAVFMVGPLASVFYLSTLDWGSILADGDFVGLDNFARLLRDPVIPVAAANTAIQLAIVLPTMILLAFMLGYFLSLRPPGYRILSVIFFTAALFSLPARAMMFVGVYMPNGIINSFLGAVGMDDWTRPWLADASTAFPAVLVVDLWGGIGFTAVLFASRISGIGHEVYEAAEIDGATQWTKMWRVTFPMILGYVGVLTMLQFLWLLLLSAQNVLLLTKGGPGNSTMTLSYYLYDQAFESSRIGYSQAIGVVLFVIGLVGVIVIRRVLRERY
jgi:multiple sugar transport system permease protein